MSIEKEKPKPKQSVNSPICIGLRSLPAIEDRRQYYFRMGQHNIYEFPRKLETSAVWPPTNEMVKLEMGAWR
jgi:hypothetical protein